MKILLVISILLLACSSGKEFLTANRESAGIAPDPSIAREAIIHVYGADVRGWMGLFTIHTWIAVKRTNEKNYWVYDVIWMRGENGQPVMAITKDIPDRYWFGAKPKLLKEYRGKGVDDLISAIDKAAQSYPWKSTFKMFPGPNSNTFVAWIAKQVPELELDLPFSAIGSGYID